MTPDDGPPKKKRKRIPDKVNGKTVVGWSEYVDFVDWGINDLKAKVDTGARTSALHVEDIQRINDNEVLFHVVLHRRHMDRRVAVHAEVVKWARVRSSTGVYKKRPFVRTRVRIGHVEKEIEISLVSREQMMFRMLLGRKALEKDFVVDVSKRAVISRRRRKTKATKKKEPRQ